jgi:hypothetical protein
VPSLTSPGTEQLEADDVMALARESNDLLPDCRQFTPNLPASYSRVYGLYGR